MGACRPSWCASGHRQPVRRTMNGAPSAVWSSTWPHGVGRRSMGSSISSISFAAASKRPRRSCQRSSTRSDQDRPTPPPAGPLPGSGPTGGMQAYESIWTWWGTCRWYGRPGWVGACPPAGQVSPSTRALSEDPPLATAQRGLWSAAGRGGGRPRPVGRPGGPDRASGPRRGGQPRAARACGIRSRCRSLRDLNRYSTG
jgi:hypothetical protein